MIEGATPMCADQISPEFDVIVIGGSYAGQSAAMQLARARRRVLIIDAGIRRNRFATAAHGFLGQDGRPPGAIVADGRTQLLAYPNLRWLDGTATRAATTDGGFAVCVGGEQSFRTRRLVLATGVVDELPEIEGLAARWGKSVFHCPYCHGYELENGRIGVLATGPASVHQALLLPDWGTVTLFTNGAFEPDDEQVAALAARGVAIEPAPIERVVETATVELADGRRIAFDGLFVASHVRVASSIAEQLDCAFDETPLGAVVRTDAMQATTTPGVFACGDMARAAGNLAWVVGDGALAGAAAHRSLIFD
jgi:thioredoxin reductase